MKPINLLLLLGGGIGIYFIVKNRNKKDNANANKAIADNTAASVQAQELYENLNITSTLGRFHISTVRLHPTCAQYQNLFNTALKIIDLNAVQDKFLKLTNNQYTLNQATADAMGSDFFTLFWNYVKAKKVVSTQDDARVYVSYKDENNNIITKGQTVAKNIILGGLTSESNTYNYALNSVVLKESGLITKTIEVINQYDYQIKKEQSTIINPV